jgi:hypothetical protein
MEQSQFSGDDEFREDEPDLVADDDDFAIEAEVEAEELELSDELDIPDVDEDDEPI